MRAGKVLYRDIWFDKPPFAARVVPLLGGAAGWRLRLAGALYALLCCWIACGFARDLWGRREGLWAAGLLGFFLIFDFPSAVIPLAADLLMLAPHMAAVWLACKRRPLWAGALAGGGVHHQPEGSIGAGGVRVVGAIVGVAGGFRCGDAARPRRGCGARERWPDIGTKSGAGDESTRARHSSIRH